MKRKIAAVLWDDHTYIDRSSIPKDPDKELIPVLSVGIIYDETEKTLVLVNCIERYNERDDASYTLILKSAILSIKTYGNIKVDELRR